MKGEAELALLVLKGLSQGRSANGIVSYVTNPCDSGWS